MVTVGERLVLPEVGSVSGPATASAVQDVALELDQARVEAVPDWIDAGVAVRVTVGAGGGAVTVTVAVADADPPAPEHASVNEVVVVGEMLAVPLVAFVPDQPPVAVQVVALVLDQVSLDAAPDWMDWGCSEGDGWLGSGFNGDRESGLSGTACAGATERVRRRSNGRHIDAAAEWAVCPTNLHWRYKWSRLRSTKSIWKKPPL